MAEGGEGAAVDPAVEGAAVDVAAVDVVCPHCKKPFTAKPLGEGAAARYRGFKCPHCKLFVPTERAADDAGR